MSRAFESQRFSVHRIFAVRFNCISETPHANYCTLLLIYRGNKVVPMLHSSHCCASPRELSGILKEYRAHGPGCVARAVASRGFIFGITLTTRQWSVVSGHHFQLPFSSLTLRTH